VSPRVVELSRERNSQDETNSSTAVPARRRVPGYGRVRVADDVVDVHNVLVPVLQHLDIDGVRRRQGDLTLRRVTSSLPQVPVAGLPVPISRYPQSVRAQALSVGQSEMSCGTATAPSGPSPW
jgi:hypothetical protein